MASVDDSLAVQYTKEIYAQRRLWATWEPNVNIALGTCGPVIWGIFRPEARLADFGIGFDEAEPSRPADVDYSSRGGIKTTFQLKGGVKAIPSIPKGNAGIRIEFAREEAAVIATKGSREVRIANQDKLRHDLLNSAAHITGIPHGWFTVTHVVTCDAASVIVALGSDAVIEIAGKADFSSGVVDLANAKLGLTVKTDQSIGYKMIAQEGATPLFRGLRVKRKLLGSLKLETLGPGVSSHELSETTEEITPEIAFVK